LRANLSIVEDLTSTFDNGISINITNSIEYAKDDGIYHKPMFIKVEISNNSSFTIEDNAEYTVTGIVRDNNGTYSVSLKDCTVVKKNNNN